MYELACSPLQMHFNVSIVCSSYVIFFSSLIFLFRFRPNIPTFFFLNFKSIRPIMDCTALFWIALSRGRM